MEHHFEQVVVGASLAPALAALAFATLAMLAYILAALD